MPQFPSITQVSNFRKRQRGEEPFPGPGGEQTNGYQNDIYIVNVDVEPIEKVHIQWVPPNIRVEPTSEFVPIHSMGRNNPLYHFTGGEDTIQFDIDWVANNEDRNDVIDKCNILKSWTKADGYEKDPPRVSIIWGDEMWADAYFLLVSAPYTLRMPHREKGLKFTKAIQQLTFKKVVEENATLLDHQNRRL